MALPKLADLVDPQRCVLATQECQNGVIGLNGGLPMLAQEARREALPNIGRLVRAARAAGVPVVHCLVQRRADGRASNNNAPLFRVGKKGLVDLSPGSDGAALLPELGPEPEDIVLSRVHGLGPMGGTDLDAVLRNLGVTTVVGVGVSVNVAIPNFAMDAVNNGYWFVLPRDAVAGVPREYADSMIDNTLSLVSVVTTTDEIIAAWSGRR
jgi:nicotinamidase-related amidase